MKQIKFCKKLILAMSCLFIIIIGYILTIEHYSEFIVEYTLATFLIIVAYIYLLPYLFRNTMYSLPVWIIFLIFVFLYICKFYLLSLEPEFGRLGSIPFTEEASASTNTMCSVYYKIALSFMSFAIVSALFYSLKKNNFISSIPLNFNVNFYRKRLKIVFTIVIVFLILTSYVSYQYRFIMGIEKEPLPFKLEGAVVYFKIIVIPFMLLSAMWFSKLYNLKKFMFISILLLFISALVNMFIRASKGSFFVFFMLLSLFFWRGGYRFNTSILIFLVSGLILSIVSFPIIGIYRYLIHTGIPLYEVFSNRDALTQFFSFNTYQNMFMQVFMRLIGSDAFSVFIAHGVNPIGLGFIELLLEGIRNVGKYITYNVFLVPYEQLEFYGIAPSLLGTLYLIGGDIGIVIGTAILSWVTLALWRFLLKSSLSVAPVIQIFFPIYILQVFSEGTIERFAFHMLPVIIFSIIVAEILFKKRFIILKRNH